MNIKCKLVCVLLIVLAGCGQEPDGRLTVDVDGELRQCHVEDWNWSRPDGFWIGTTEGDELAVPADSHATATINWYMDRLEARSPLASADDAPFKLFPGAGSVPPARVRRDQERLDRDLSLRVSEEDATAEEIQAMIAAGADPNGGYDLLRSGGHPLLQAAFFTPDAGIVQVLLDAGADVSVTDEDGCNALLTAVLYNDSTEVADMVRMLILAGIDADAVDDSGDSPLDIATRRATDPNLLLALVEGGATVEVGHVLRVADNSSMSGTLVESAMLAKLQTIDFGELSSHKGLNIRLVGARIGQPQLQGGGNGVDEKLIIELGIQNTDARKILRLERFTLGRSFSLIDDALNTIRGPASYRGAIVGELTSRDDILPGESASHVLCFAVPPPMTESLYLIVDLSVFGRGAKVVLELPANQVEGFLPAQSR